MNKTLSFEQIFSVGITLVVGDKYIDDSEEKAIGAALGAEAANMQSCDDDSLFMSSFAYRQNTLSMAEGSGRLSLPCDSNVPILIKWPNGLVDLIEAGKADWRAAFEWKPHLTEVLKLVYGKNDKQEPKAEQAKRQAKINYWRETIELYKFEPERFAALLADSMIIKK